MHWSLSISLCTLLLSHSAASTPVQYPFLNQQPDSTGPIDYPYRQLPWGDVNVISTTDTHGWLLGHQRNEPSFSGDWGDLYSFVTRMKEEAKRRGVDLLVVDSGDRVDGHGLVDAEPPSHPKGYTALSIFSQLPYDLITTGNHELYRYPVAEYAREVLSDKYGEKWVVSNVNITLKDNDGGDGEREVLMGNRLRKFETEMGRKVTAFGPLFDFKAHAPGITVQKPSEMVKEQWFLDAIADRPDFFLFAGHMSVRIEPDSEWRTIIRSIRKVHPKVPVLVFGGHHHIRDCVQEDKYSMTMAAGRYMETIGFASVSGLDAVSGEVPRFARRYLDQNRNSYIYHSQAGSEQEFDTEQGMEISKELERTATRFNLTEQFGTSPQDYFLHRYPSTSPHSIFHLLTTEILPTLIDRDDRPYESFTVLNTGSVRFDLFKGPFTRNDQWIALPFPNNFLYIPAVPTRLAKKLIPYLNLVGEHGFLPSQQFFSPPSHTTSSDSDFSGATLLTVQERNDRLGLTTDQLIAAEEAHLELSRRHSLLRSTSIPVEDVEETSTEASGKWKMMPLSEGYVTLDSCAGLGDDTLHTPFKVSRQPIFVSTDLPTRRSPRLIGKTKEGEGEDEEKVDVVFFDFIQPDILSALNYLDQDSSDSEDMSSMRRRREWVKEDVKLYLEDLTANTLLETWAKRAWN